MPGCEHLLEAQKNRPTDLAVTLSRKQVNWPRMQGSAEGGSKTVIEVIGWPSS